MGVTGVTGMSDEWWEEMTSCLDEAAQMVDSPLKQLHVQCFDSAVA